MFDKSDLGSAVRSVTSGIGAVASLATPQGRANARAFVSEHAGDFAAGLSVVGILVPEAVAYSGIAHMPPIAGLIGLLAGLIVYFLIGTSPYAIVSATSSSCMIIAVSVAAMSAIQPDAHPATLAAMLVMLTGVWFILARLLNLGRYANFVAKPVLRGVTMGLSLTIIIMQLPKLLGLHIPTRNPWERLWEVIQALPSLDWPGVSVGLIALFVLFAWCWPKQPSILWVVIGSVAVTYFVPLENYGVELVGKIELEMTELNFASLLHADWFALIQSSIAIALILYAESYSSIGSMAARNNIPVNSNRDILAIGVANLVSGFTGGTSVGAGFSATVLNEQAGAKTKFSSLFSLFLFAIVLMFLMPYISRIPEPVLAAIVIKAVSHGLSPKPMMLYFKWKRDRVLVVVAFLAVALMGVLNGLLLSIVLSMVLILIGSLQGYVSELQKLEGSHNYVNTKRFSRVKPTKGILILRPDQPLFFGNADPMIHRIRKMLKERNRRDPVEHLILSMEECPDLDGTGIEALITLAKSLNDRGVGFTLCRMHRLARRALLNAANPYLMPSQLSSLSVERAIKDILEKKDPEELQSMYTPGARRLGQAAGVQAPTPMSALKDEDEPEDPSAETAEAEKP